MPVSELSDAVATPVKAAAARAIEHVYFVACGGSLSIMYPAKFLLDQHSARLSSDVMNAQEFITRAPKRLGAKSLVILCSMTGTTKETVNAAAFARKSGALTVALANSPTSPLAQASDHFVPFESFYTTGVPIDARDGNYSKMYQLVMGLVAEIEGEDHVSSLLNSLSHLQGAIDRAHQTFAPLFEDYAPRLAKEPVIYTVSSGADFGAAYSFSICVLMEMQWIDSQAIHANEFFHGPFEVASPEKSFIVLKGLDSTRSLEERAETFLNRVGSSERVMVVDAAKLDLSGIDPTFAGVLTPLIFFDTLWRFAYKIADLRGQRMLEDRRYMKKIFDY